MGGEGPSTSSVAMIERKVWTIKEILWIYILLVWEVELDDVFPDYHIFHLLSVVSHLSYGLLFPISDIH